MSNNIFNIEIPVPIDPNSYRIDDLKIEFMTSFKKEYNEIMLNRTYQFQPLQNTDGVYQKAEFQRKPPFTYLKIKNKELWLHQDHKNSNLFFFDKIRCDDFTYKQPFVVWLQYTREGEFIVYRLLGYGLDSVIKRVHDKLTNIEYLNYNQNNDKINIKWVDDVNLATKFYYKKVKWNEFSWIKLYSKEQQNQLLSR